jgi:hypothetical protein
MLIYRQNSYMPCSKWCTGRREAQGCGTNQKSKILPVYSSNKEEDMKKDWE